MTESTNEKLQILLVDDTPANLQLLMGMLDGRYYEVRVATSGQRALATAKRAPPDLIMLDISMPDMDGYNVCRELKADPTTRDVPVIFVSALDEGMDKVRAFEVGGADYLTKPCQFFEVIARLEHQLKIARLQKEMARSNEEFEARNRELEAKNRELERRNEELARAHKKADPIFTTFSDALAGTVLDARYRLEEKIGSGTYGTVYRAVHLGLNREVAIRVLRPKTGTITAEGLERFRAEGLAACRLIHPNAVLTFDFGIASGIPYLATELLEGHSLLEEMRGNPLTIERCAQILVPVCDVLAEAHGSGVVHRDLRPENIFLHRTPGGKIVKLLDFGLATLFARGANPASAGTTAEAPGEWLYVAPERRSDWSGDSRSDIYSLGAIVHEALSGRPPYGDAGASEEATPLRLVAPNIPEAIEASVMRALSRAPDMRPTAKEFANSLVMALLSSPRDAGG